MAAPKVSWNEGYIQTNGINIHYFRSSPSPSISVLPILIFLHGMANGGALQIPYMSFLADEFDIILPDGRGCCKTKPIPKGTFTMDNLVKDAIEVIKHFSEGNGVYLVGHSAGASIAARVAKAIPNLVKAAVLEDPPWFRTPDQPLNPSERSILGLLPYIRQLKAMSDDEFAKYDTMGANFTPPALSLNACFRQFDIENCESTFQDTDDDINIAVEEIVIPTLLMTGDNASGSRCKREITDRVLATWPLGKECHFEKGGHVLHLMREKWLREVRSFFPVESGNVQS